MRGGDYTAMPEDYVRIQNMKPAAHSTTTGAPLWPLTLGEGVWDVVEELGEAEIRMQTPLLTLGCCTGHECMQLRKVFPGRIVGVDIVPEFVRAARMLSSENRLGLEFRVADIHELPFADQEFDSVYSRGTLEHCYNLERAAAEMKRVCGRLVCVSADLVPEGHRRIGAGDYAFSDDKEEWRELFRGPGWTQLHEWTEPSYREYEVLYMVWGRDGAP